eukprot:TRINITY_DN1465_c0_g2_i1.p1 TRINITY_DN1465_c0_g2~~TRINITY_DN1465_c0_g2_i1.p1  ORF type:complete len:490 (+),score=132.26 TRINITY_DN1465_c0_g2_i1:41-1510(+)
MHMHDTSAMGETGHGAPLAALPVVPQPLSRGCALQHGTGGGSRRLPWDVVGQVVAYLSENEREVLRQHGMLLDWTRLECKTNCGCSPGCSHPAEWNYDRIAHLVRFRRVGAQRRMIWHFDPPIYISEERLRAAAAAAASSSTSALRQSVTAPPSVAPGLYVSISVEMNAEATVLRPTLAFDEADTVLGSGGSGAAPVLWWCPGASYHFLSLFIRERFDVVVAKNVDMSSHNRQVSDLRLLHYELVVAKKEAGFAFPLSADSGEWPPALLFDNACSGSACLCCQQKMPSRHWKTSLRDRLDNARVSMVSGVLDLTSAGLSLTTPGTRTSLSVLNQDADIVSQAVAWGAVQFLQKVVDAKVDFFSRRSRGCPLYYLSAVLGSLAQYLISSPADRAEKERLLRLVLDVLPRGAFTLTPSCVSRGESISDVSAALDTFLAALPVQDLPAVVEHHHSLVDPNYPSACLWCAATANHTSPCCPPAGESSAAAGVL